MTLLPRPTGQLKAMRLQAFLKLLPSIQLFTLIDALLLTWYFWPEVNRVFLLGWLAAAVLHCATWATVALKGKPREGWINVFAALEAVLFCVFLIVVFPSIPPGKAVVLAAFATGILAAGGLTKGTLPVSAVLYSAVFTLGAALAVLRAPIPDVWVPEALLVAFGVAVSFLAVNMSRVFDARVGAESELDRQKTLVTHLLTDFEESASEGLWETDPEGRLTSISPRLEELFGVTAGDWMGRPLVPWHDWVLVLERGTPFRNLAVSVELGGPRRWWSLNGKPIKNDQGEVIGWRGVGSDVTEARQQELEMVRLSQVDGLTGLYNRPQFRSLLDGHFISALEPDPWCLILVDLADFKDVNESRGHNFGDALLRAVADRLRRIFPQEFTMARLDGDEFALMGPVSRSLPSARSALGRLLDRLGLPYEVLGDRFEAGIRLGVSFLPGDASTPEQWLRCADLALRTAKAAGRQQLIFYKPEMMESFRLRNLLKEDLHGALERGEMELHFQPLVDLKHGEVVGLEALLRWNHPIRGRVSPADFIPLAEETELILELGLWILEEACRTALEWPGEIGVSVNVSGVQLRSANLAEDIAEVLAKVGFDPKRLILEVTESALIKDDVHVVQCFATLKKKGVRWALDDFGTGFSALSYLQNFPFDKLKIDQSFVRSLPSKKKSPALLGAMVQLARSLGLKTTAEGIETDEQFETLRELGCDEGQGYLFSAPVPAEGITVLRAQWEARAKGLLQPSR